MKKLTSIRAIGELLIERQTRLIVESLIIGGVFIGPRRRHRGARRVAQLTRTAPLLPRVLPVSEMSRLTGPGRPSADSANRQAPPRDDGRLRLNDVTRAKMYIGVCASI